MAKNSMFFNINAYILREKNYLYYVLLTITKTFYYILKIKALYFSRLDFLKAATLSLATVSVVRFLWLLKKILVMQRFTTDVILDSWASHPKGSPCKNLFNTEWPAYLDGTFDLRMASALASKRANPWATESLKPGEGIKRPPRGSRFKYSPLVSVVPLELNWWWQHPAQVFLNL